MFILFLASTMCSYMDSIRQNFPFSSTSYMVKILVSAVLMCNNSGDSLSCPTASTFQAQNCVTQQALAKPQSAGTDGAGTTLGTEKAMMKQAASCLHEAHSLEI